MRMHSYDTSRRRAASFRADVSLGLTQAVAFFLGHEVQVQLLPHVQLSPVP